MALHLFERLEGVAQLSMFILVAFYGILYGLMAIRNFKTLIPIYLGVFLVAIDILISRLSLSEINTSDKFSAKVFGKVWPIVSPITYKRELETDVPKLVASASGVVLEVGPGDGNQVGRYDKTKVTKIYGIEPTTELHSALSARVKAHGLQDVYTIVPCGIEDTESLRSFGLTEGSIDTVVSVQVLCGVPQPKEMIRRLYALLKPGGRMVVYEHVRAVDSISRKIQDIFQIIWPHLLGGCELIRPTSDWLLQAGKWEKVSLKLPEQDDPWRAVPHVSGTLTKAK